MREALHATGWSLHPSFDRYGDQVSFADPQLFAEDEHDVASAWGALATGLYFALHQIVPAEWPFSSLQFNAALATAEGVGGLPEKIRVAADAGGTALTVARSQRRFAAECARELWRITRDERFKSFKIIPATTAPGAERLAADVAIGRDLRRRRRRLLTVAGTLAAAVTTLLFIRQERHRLAETREAAFKSAAAEIMRADRHTIPGREVDAAWEKIGAAAELPQARDFLLNQLMSRSWMVPVEVTPPSGRFQCLGKLGARLGARLAEPTDPTGCCVNVTEKFNPTRHLLASDPTTGQERWKLELGERCYGFAYSENRRWLAFATASSLIRIILLETGEDAFEPVRYPDEIFSVLFEDGDRRLVACTKNGDIHFALFHQPSEWESGTDPCHCTFQTVVSADGSTRWDLRQHTIEIFRPADSHTLYRRYRFACDGAALPALSRDGRRLALAEQKVGRSTEDPARTTSAFFASPSPPEPSGPIPSTVTLIDLPPAPADKPTIRHLELPFVAGHLSFSPDGKRLYLCAVGRKPSDPNHVYCWKEEKPDVLSKTELQDALPLQGVLALDDGQVLTLGACLKRWEPVSANCRWQTSEPYLFCDSIASAGNAFLVLAQRNPARVTILNRQGKRVWQSACCFSRGAVPYAVDATHRRVAVPIRESVVQVFDFETGREATDPFTLPYTLESLRFLNDGDRSYLVASGSETGALGASGVYWVLDVNHDLVVRKGGQTGKSLKQIIPLSPTACLVECKLNDYPFRFEVPAWRPEGESARGARRLLRFLKGGERVTAGLLASLAGELDGRWGEFLAAARAPLARRPIHAFSETPFESLAAFLREGNSSKGGDVLDAIPDDLQATASCWKHRARQYAALHDQRLDSLRGAARSLRLLHPEASFEEAVANDPLARDYADRITRFMLKRHPGDPAAQGMRQAFEAAHSKTASDKKGFSL